MNILRRYFVLALLAIAASATSPCAVAQTNVYIELDQRWYEAPVPGSTAFAWLARPTWYLPGARMDLCNRSDGLPQVYGAFTAYVGAFSNPVRSITEWRLYRHAALPNKTILSISTAPGNVVCSYEVASPLPAVIFRSGFEKDGVFTQGFDQ